MNLKISLGNGLQPWHPLTLSHEVKNKKEKKGRSPNASYSREKQEDSPLPSVFYMLVDVIYETKGLLLSSKNKGVPGA